MTSITRTVIIRKVGGIVADIIELDGVNQEEVM